MVEEFETLTLVHKALDLKTRDLVELGAFQGGSAIELRHVWNTSAQPPSATALLKICGFFLGISDSATRHGGHMASANTRVATDRRFIQRGEGIRSGPSLAYPAV